MTVTVWRRLTSISGAAVALCAAVTITASAVAAPAASPTPTPTPSASPSSAPVRVSGVIVDKQGLALVDPTCVYFWPKDAQAIDGWRMSVTCVELTEIGGFVASLPVGDYKVQVEATNVLDGMFVGGLDLAKAKTLTVSAKGLVGQVLKVDTLTKVVGTVTGTGGTTLANPNCVYFWNQDKTVTSGWVRPDECADLDETGAFLAWVPSGSHKVEVQADNVAADTFAGRDGTLANGTVVKVGSKPLLKVALTVPVQPPLSGRFVLAGGAAMPRPASLTVWVPDATDASGWTPSTDSWWVDSTGAFTIYLDPGIYRLQLSYGKPSKSVFFGGASIQNARDIVMPARALSGLSLRIGTFTAPAAPSNATVSTFDSSLFATWTPAPAPSVVTYSIVRAEPGGFTCVTTSNECTLSSLKNGIDYTVTLTSVNESGASVVALGTWRPAVPTPAVTVDPLIVPGGGAVTLSIRNLPGNLPVTISGKPALQTQSLVSSPLGAIQTTFNVRGPGKIQFSIKGKKVSLAAYAFVPTQKFPATAKVGKSVDFSVSNLPARVVVQFAVGSTKTVVTSDAKGVATASLTFPKSGQFTVTATVNSLTVGSGQIAVS